MSWTRRSASLRAKIQFETWGAAPGFLGLRRGAKPATSDRGYNGKSV